LPPEGDDYQYRIKERLNHMSGCSRKASSSESLSNGRTARALNAFIHEDHLCEDHVGTYVIPFLCQWTEGTWQNAKTRRRIEVAVIGWREPKRNQR
jgi:hypothetical protein